MTHAQRRYLLLEHVLGSAVFTFALNAAIAWLLFRGLARVPFWGAMSIAGDTISTSLILPFMTCVSVTWIVRRHLRKGRVAPLRWSPARHPVALAALARLPRGTLLRALAVSVVAAVALAPVTLVVMHAFRVAQLPFCPFVAFKAGFATVEAVLVTPVVALWVMAFGGGGGARSAVTPAMA